MNAFELNQEWQRVCSTIGTYSNIDEKQFSAFFSRLHPQAMSPGFLMLTADNDFIKKWVEIHYLHIIRQALQDMNGIDFEVIIEVDEREEEPQEPPQSQAGPVPEAKPDSIPTASGAPLPEEAEKDEAAGAAANQADSLLADNGPIGTFTFGNFVIGDSNRMAYSMAVAVAEQPGKTQWNPLFIYGRSGLGKTHLLRAVQHYLHETVPTMKVIYADSAEFLNDYVEAITSPDTDKRQYKLFKQRYEEADVLLIDDVQWLQDKKSTLEIVFQLFNKLTNRGKQIILSADRAPKNIDIDERYISRFSQGGIVSIQPPEIETKLGIIKSYIEDFRIDEGYPDFQIPEDVQMYIANISSSNIRELKGAITRVVTEMIFLNKTITLEGAKVILENHFSSGSSKHLTIEDIQHQVETYYKVSHAELIGKKRARNITTARQVAIYLSRTMLDVPYNEIGKKFNQHHTTIMYSAQNIEQKLKESRDLQEEIEVIKNMIREM